jgi:hypothetical protein
MVESPMSIVCLITIGIELAPRVGAGVDAAVWGRVHGLGHWLVK